MSPVRAVPGLRQSGKGREGVLYLGHPWRFALPVSLVHDPQELLVRYAPTDPTDGGPAMSGSLYDLGLPYPIWDTRPSPAEASARSATRQGAQVHAAVARHAPLVALVGEDDDVIEAAVTALVVGRENGNVRRARVRVSLLVRQYLRVFLPHGGVFAGSEVPASGGRADLLWAHPVGYFYDEIKTVTGPDPLTKAPSSRWAVTPAPASGASGRASPACASSPSAANGQPCSWTPQGRSPHSSTPLSLPPHCLNQQQQEGHSNDRTGTG